MPSSQIETLRWQFRLTRELADYHLPKLTDTMCLWEPAPGSWSVRKTVDGRWLPDWSDKEPDPAPPTTIGWLTWHLIWWWTSLQATLQNETPVPREEVMWPGDAAATIQRLDKLSADWTAILSGLKDSDLERPVAYPWKEPRPLAIALAWANSELMKNVAEIGSMRHLFEARG